MLSLHGLETSDAGTDADAHTVGIFLLHVDAGHLESFLGGSYRKLGERLHSLGCLGIHVCLRVEVLDLGGQLCLVVGGIKVGDGPDAHGLILNAGPELLHAVSDGGDGSHTGHYNSVLHLALSFT